MNKKLLSERDICTKFIIPAVKLAGWDEMSQIREEVSFTKGRIIVRGKLVTRGKAKRADCILYYKPNIPIAIIEAKDNNHNVGDGMQQALDYAATLDIPFVFSSNGDGFVFHDRTSAYAEKESNLSLEAFPSFEERRIVAKVDELMAVCDRLESQLTSAQTESRRLLETVLHEALATAG
jgi:type I restriction enzyme, R subunit